MEFSGKAVLITGGASGIGKIMGRKALERGAKALIIWDINEEGIEAVKSEFAPLNANIIGYRVDVSNVEEIQQTADQTNAEVGAIDILINNAGIVVGSYFHEHSHNDISKSMAINTDALMHITLEFLPQMMKRNSGAICNICSSASLISNPKMSVYAASKWAAAGWSDSLRLEMKTLKKDISVTTMMPYYINTGMFDGVKSKVIPILKPEAASEKIIRAIENKRKLISWPIPYWFVRLSQGLLPLPIFEWFMRDVFKVYDTMTDFIGRK